MKKIIGVYRIRHKKSGTCYVGGSINIGSRWSVHKSKLKNGCHHKELQVLYDRDGADSFVFEILETCSKRILKKREDFYALKEKKRVGRTNMGFHFSLKQRRKMSRGRARYLETPGARESLSERAKKQHVNGNFGAKTWKTGPRYNPKSGIAGACALRKHIASQSSEEMSRRSYMRKIFR